MKKFAGIRMAVLIASATALTMAAERSTMYVDGRHLYDKCGEKVLIRGYNVMSLYWDGYGGQNGDWSNAGKYSFEQIAKTGANTCRIFWVSHHGSEGWRLPAHALEATIKNCIDNNMIAMPELHNCTGDCSDAQFKTLIDYWCSSDIVAVIKKYESKLLINIANESIVGTGSDFVDTYSAAVKRMREAGITPPIVIDGGDNYATNHRDLISGAPQILQKTSDPNLIFSFHTYHPSNCVGYNYEQSSETYYRTIFQNAANADICFIAGEFGRVSGWPLCETAALDWKGLIKAAHETETGWLVWVWQCCGTLPDNHSVTSDRTYGHWANGTFGEEISISNTYSIKNTSIRTSFFAGGICNGSTKSIGSALVPSSTRKAGVAVRAKCFSIKGAILLSDKLPNGMLPAERASGVVVMRGDDGVLCARYVVR